MENINIDNKNLSKCLDEGKFEENLIADFIEMALERN